MAQMSLFQGRNRAADVEPRLLGEQGKGKVDGLGQRHWRMCAPMSDGSGKLLQRRERSSVLSHDPEQGGGVGGKGAGEGGDTHADV